MRTMQWLHELSGALFGIALLTTSVDAQATTRSSVDSTGAEGNGDSFSMTISADGRFVAFQSAATNLVVNDTNGKVDVFVRDRRLGTTERISVSSTGAEGDGDSQVASLSADGRFVAFQSVATNLVPGDTNGFVDVFVRDRLSGTTERVSVDSSGAQADSPSTTPSLSADGRFVAFMSGADDLVANDVNGSQDVFVHDRSMGTTEIVSVDSAGTLGNLNSYASSISADGQFVAFYSFATNLVASDTNNVWDVFVHDRATGTTELVSVDSFGNQGNRDSYAAAISADGRFVAFQSLASNLVPFDSNSTWDVFVHDRQTGTTERASVSSSGLEGNGSAGVPTISGDGRFVAFMSAASNLVAGDTNSSRDVFLRDMQTLTTTRVSVDATGAQGNSHSDGAKISADGRFVAFYSSATSLVAGDGNGKYDVFVHGPWLTLEVDPPRPVAGATLTFETFTGLPSGAAMLVAIDVNGSPLFSPIVFAAFDAAGVWTFSATVPTGLSGLDVTFESFGIVPPNRVAASNASVVSFQ